MTDNGVPAGNSFYGKGGHYDVRGRKAVIEEEQAVRAKVSAYGLFQDVEVPYPWVSAILRLIRSVLTILLVVIV